MEQMCSLIYCTHGHGASAGTKDCIRRHDVIENTYTPSLSRVGIAGKLLLMHQYIYSIKLCMVTIILCVVSVDLSIANLLVQYPRCCGWTVVTLMTGYK